MATNNHDVGAAAKRDRRRFKVRHLGIHGARSTGKTCYLACCLYGESVTSNSGGDQDGADAASVIVGDAPSLRSLQEAWAKLTRGELPQANAVTIPDEIGFSLLAGKQRWKVETRDYAGALVQLTETGQPELRGEVNDWLVDSDAILVLVNADLRDGDPAARERMSEVEAILQRLLDDSPDGNTVKKPLAILLTKWDVQGQLSDDPAHEDERALAYLRSHSVFRQLVTKIEAAGDRVKVFPVSAFGGHRDGNLPPDRGPQPFNLHAPLVWAAQKADEALFEAAKQEADSWVGADRKWKRYGHAIGCYRTLIKNAGINKGPVYDNIRSELRPLRKARRKRTFWLGTTVLIVICMLAVGVLFRGDGSQWRQVKKQLAGWRGAIERRADDEDFLTVARAKVQAVSLPTVFVVSHWRNKSREDDFSADKDAILTSVDGKLDAIHEQRDQQLDSDFELLEAYIRANPEDDKARERLARIAAFRGRWPRDGWRRMRYEHELNKWETEGREAHERYVRITAFDTALEELHVHSRSEESLEKKVELFTEFLDEWPESRCPERKDEIAGVRDERERILVVIGERKLKAVQSEAQSLASEGQYEEAIGVLQAFLGTRPEHRSVLEGDLAEFAWEKVDEYAEKHPTNHDRIVELVREYIERTDVPKQHLSEAKDLKREEEIAWDRAVYRQVESRAEAAYSPEIAKRRPGAIREAMAGVEQYLRERGRRITEQGFSRYERLEAFWNALETWADTARTLVTHRPVTYQVRVSRVEIPEGATRYTTSSIRVTVEGSGRPAEDTAWMKGRPLVVDQVFGPFRARWDEEGTFRVRVTESGYTPWWHRHYEAPTPVKDAAFLPGRLTGVVRVPARNHKHISVHLEATTKVGEQEIGIPPRLPSYPRFE